MWLLATLETYMKQVVLLLPFCVLQKESDILKSVRLSQMLLMLLYLSYQFNLSLINRHEPLTWYCQKRQDTYCGIGAFCLPPSAIPEPFFACGCSVVFITQRYTTSRRLPRRPSLYFTAHHIYTQLFRSILNKHFNSVKIQQNSISLQVCKTVPRGTAKHDLYFCHMGQI